MARAHGGRARAVVTLVLLILTASTSTACDAHRICRLGGCSSGITVRVDGLDIRSGETYVIDACLDHECHTATVQVDTRLVSERDASPQSPTTFATSGESGAFHLSGESDTINISLTSDDHVELAFLDMTVETEDGTLIADAVGVPVQLWIYEGNGPGCGVCILPSPEMNDDGVVVIPPA